MKKPLFTTRAKSILAVLVLAALLPTTVFAEDAPEANPIIPVVLEEVIPDVVPDVEPDAIPAVEPDAIVLPQVAGDALLVAATEGDGEEKKDEDTDTFDGVEKWEPTVVADHTGITFSHPEFRKKSNKPETKGIIAKSYSLRIEVNGVIVLEPEIGNYNANEEYSYKFETPGVNDYFITLWAHYEGDKPGAKHQLGQRRGTSPAVPEVVVPPVTPPVTPPSTPSDDDDDDDDDVGIDYTAIDTTTIEDAPVPLASAPLLTILDEDVPLGNLPKTGGSSTILIRLGMGAVLLGVLICTSATKK